MARHAKKRNFAALKRIGVCGGALLCVAALGLAVFWGVQTLSSSSPPTGNASSVGTVPRLPTTTGANASLTTGTALPTGTSSTTATGSTTGNATSTTGGTTVSTSGTTATTTTTTATTTTTTTTATETTASTTTTTTTVPSVPSVPPTVTEDSLRAVWVSYIELADFLSGSEARAKEKIDTLISDCRALGLNTIFYHARANSDAFYLSSYFPYAYGAGTLLGQGFDPLAYTVEKAHAVGIEVHAWVNPYRIGTREENARSDQYFAQGSSYYYLPSSTEVQTLLLNGVKELLAYGVDGIHFDDYFYPEGVADNVDAADYAAYLQGGGTLAKADWRRSQVTELLKRVYAAAHAADAVFGVAPMADIAGNYSLKFADIEGWMQAPDVIDYICPQLYYGFENSAKPFAQTVDAWLAMPRHASVKVYVGLGLYKAGMLEDAYAGGGKYEWAGGGDIFARQVRLLEQKNVGFSLYSYAYLTPSRFNTVADCDVAVATREIEALLEELRG